MSEHFESDGQSLSINLLAPALVLAQGAMVSPRRNRSVKVKMKTGGEYTFKYTTLDAINDMIREPLASNGLCLTQRLVQTKPPSLVTRLLHESGQWLETSMPVQPTSNDPQALGAAITYVRRYSIVGLLNISSDEDDDGAAASDRHSQPVQKNDGEHFLSERFRRLIEAANRAYKPEDIGDVLKLWQRDMDGFLSLRNQPERVVQWERLATDLPAAIARAMGDSFGNAWKACLLATKRSDLVEMRKSWDGEWSAGASFAKKAWPQAYALLAEHMRAQVARVEATAEEEDIAAEIPEPLKVEPVAEPDFFHYLMDSTGEIVSGPFTYPSTFLHALAALPFDSAEADRNLLQHNDLAIELCRTSTDPDVLTLLADIVADLEADVEPIEVIALKSKRGGATDLAAYLAGAQKAIQTLSAVGLQAWVEANAPTYTTLPQGTKMQVLKAIAERTQAL